MPVKFQCRFTTLFVHFVNICHWPDSREPSKWVLCKPLSYRVLLWSGKIASILAKNVCDFGRKCMQSLVKNIILLSHNLPQKEKRYTFAPSLETSERCSLCKGIRWNAWAVPAAVTILFSSPQMSLKARCPKVLHIREDGEEEWKPEYLPDLKVETTRPQDRGWSNCEKRKLLRWMVKNHTSVGFWKEVRRFRFAPMSLRSMTCGLMAEATIADKTKRCGSGCLSEWQ